MEKLIYVIWKRPESSIEDFKRDILGNTAEKLMGLGARKLSVNLADELAAYAQGIRITRLPEPMAGTLSIWLDTALGRQPLEAVIANATAHFAGYLVLESVPIVNTTRVAPPGERTPGITTVAFLRKPEAMAYDAWREQWQGHHTRVAIETQSTFLYIQNVVVRPLTQPPQVQRERQHHQRQPWPVPEQLGDQTPGVVLHIGSLSRTGIWVTHPRPLPLPIQD